MTTESQELFSLVQEGREVVLDDPKHHLPLWVRWRIWMAMGEGRGSGVGHRRRVALAAESVRHVLPVWEKRYPDDKAPHLILQAIPRLLGRDSIGHDVLAMSRALWERLVEVSWDEAEFVPACVGFAAVQALKVAISDEPLLGRVVDQGVGDDDIEPEDTDAAIFASAAHAGGAPWMEGGSATRRLEFWERWLSEVVPQAFNASRVGLR